MNKKQVSQINEALKLNKGPETEVKNPNKGINALLPPKEEPKMLSTTRRTLATVKVMNSYNYCHFEASIQLEGDYVTIQEIDNARKDCQRLVDKAIGQYKTAKEKETTRANNTYERQRLENEVTEIKKKKDEFLTPEDQAKIKALADYYHNNRYNYEDDGEYLFPGY